MRSETQGLLALCAQDTAGPQPDRKPQTASEQDSNRHDCRQKHPTVLIEIDAPDRVNRVQMSSLMPIYLDAGESDVEIAVNDCRKEVVLL